LIYRSRSLRRLFEVKVYRPAKGKEPGPRTKTTKETVIAWNAVDAIRQVAPLAVAEQPRPLVFVTWDEPPRVIHNPTEGPMDEIVRPTMGAEAGW